MAIDLDVVTYWPCKVATYPPGATYGPRVMRDYEFVWLIEGDARYRWGDIEVAAPAGSIVLCRPGATDFFAWDAHARTRHGFFHFDVRSFPVDWPEPGDWPLVRQPRGNDLLPVLLRHMLAWSGRGDDMQRRLTAAHILTAFITGQSACEEVSDPAWPAAVEKAWAHLHRVIEEEPGHAIDLAELARVACVSPEHLCRLFKQSTGRSPMETIRLARLDRAAMLLARSNYSVSEVASLCGFANAFHFTRRFGAAFGYPPSQVRKRIEADGMGPVTLLVRVK